MTEAYTRDFYDVETSADVVTATRIARAVPVASRGALLEPVGIGFGQPDSNASQVPI